MYKNLLMIVRKLTIKMKLILLVSTLVVLLFIVGILSINMRNKISGNEYIKVQFKNLSIHTLELREFERDFLLLDANNRQFFETGKSAYVEQFDNTMKSIQEILAGLNEKELIIKNNFNLNDLSVLNNNYAIKFHELVELKRQRGNADFGLIGEMRKTINTAEGTIGEIKGNNLYLVSQILALKEVEKDYLFSNDTNYIGKFLNAHAKLMNSGISGSTADLLMEYQKAFNSITALDRQIKFTEEQDLAGTVCKIRPAVDAMILDVDAIIKKENLRSVQWIYLMLAIGLIAVVLSYLVIRFIIASITHAIKTLEKIAGGNLNFEIVADREDEVGTLLKTMKLMTSKLKEVIKNIRAASGNIASATMEMHSSTQQMSEGATEQASSVEQVSSSMQQMAANIQQNTDNSVQTEKIAKKASAEIEESNVAVEKTMDSMKTIASKISIIGEIARQTNLLALNAAVEAARAGEHGRGFAVVAAEVRKLAERSQEAATEIDQLSSTSVNVAQKSRELLSNAVPNIQKTAELVQEITAASVEQNTGSEQINNAIQQLNHVVQANAATAEELAATTQELNAQSSILKEMISYFDIGEDLKVKNVASVKVPADNKKQSKTQARSKTTEYTKTSTPSKAEIQLTANVQPKANVLPKTEVQSKVEAQPKTEVQSVTEEQAKPVIVPKNKSVQKNAPVIDLTDSPTVTLNHKDGLDFSDKDYERF
jgi:methyl-accepting chemotaxis protein